MSNARHKNTLFFRSSEKRKQQLKNDVRKADTLPKVLDTSVMQNPDSAVGFSFRTN